MVGGEGVFLMSNVVAFPEPKIRNARARAPMSGSVTLFVHVRRATLIAHLTGRVRASTSRDERIGKS
jgi:hypothetical protein